MTVTTELPCSVERAREEVGTSRLLLYVSWPLVEFLPVDPPVLPPTWQAGDHLVRMRLFGLVPLGRQTISISFPPTTPDRVLLRDNGSGDLLRRWDHLITIAPGSSPTRARYTDRIDVDAGLLTSLAWAWAHVLYRWRQHRWRYLAARGFRYPPARRAHVPRAPSGGATRESHDRGPATAG
ncbi:hypothetical protein ACI8AD_12810 [Geodermatophilus sp. SYSU D00766]